jgi:2-polyprenyl-3-methyl-5-hydroxy-6-metoxy-1,4-benzoquinol methylase
MQASETNFEMPMIKCHLCGGEIRNLEAFSSLVQVTSDCCSWFEGGQLSVCQQCGTVQKPVTESWRRSTEHIYSDYKIYRQGAGAEQLAFETDTGTSKARSKKIAEWLTTHHAFPETGDLLEIGCGNGAFLKEFGARNPKWRMIGLELDQRNQRAIESIPGVTRLHVGSIESLQNHFDLIVLIHSLEHIPHPIEYLHSLSRHLSSDGLLLIEVPNFEMSPFDILVADHCTHFTSDILRRVVAYAGFKILSQAADFVPKELSLLAQDAGMIPTRTPFRMDRL